MASLTKFRWAFPELKGPPTWEAKSISLERPEKTSADSIVVVSVLREATSGFWKARQLVPSKRHLHMQPRDMPTQGDNAA